MEQPMHEITPTPSAQYRVDLEEFERDDGRPAFALNMTEIKLLGIAGVCPLSPFLISLWRVQLKVGFFLDGKITIYFRFGAPLTDSLI